MATHTNGRNTHNGETLHVWLVEDSEADELLMRAALKLDGLDCEFQVSPDGEKAIEFIEAIDSGTAWHRPHVVLLDLNLPRATGNRILARIRGSHRCTGMPIIIVTSSDSPVDRAAAAESGATGYFQKPGDLAGFMQLGRIVRDALGMTSAAGKA